MKNKLEIVKDLVDNDVITFEEALILLDFEVDKPKPTHQVFNLFSNSTATTKVVPSTFTNASNSDLETK